MKTVLITGASRGIGKATAELFQEVGHKVISPSRDELDLSNQASVLEFINRNHSLEVDILINNAGQNIIQEIFELDGKTWSVTQDVNVNSPFLLSKAFAEGMVRRKWGRIVNVASVFSCVTRKGRAAYTTSKAALVGFTRTAALEWAPHNVLVNAISPGFVETDLTRKNNTPEKLREICDNLPIGRLALPIEIAQLVFFLASEQNTFTTGQNIIADGGFTLV